MQAISLVGFELGSSLWWLVAGVCVDALTAHEADAWSCLHWSRFGAMSAGLREGFYGRVPATQGRAVALRVKPPARAAVSTLTGWHPSRSSVRPAVPAGIATAAVRGARCRATEGQGNELPAAASPLRFWRPPARPTRHSLRSVSRRPQGRRCSWVLGSTSLQPLRQASWHIGRDAAPTRGGGSPCAGRPTAHPPAAPPSWVRGTCGGSF